MNLRDILLKELDSELATTKKFLALLPADKIGYKPHEKSMELGRLAGHIAESFGWGVTTLEMEKFTLDMGEWKPLTPANGEEAVKALEEQVAKFRASLEKATNESLMVTWEMVYGGQTVVKAPRIEVLRSFMFSHVVHHRAQLGVYYRLLGVPVPSTYGPSADDQQGM